MTPARTETRGTQPLPAATDRKPCPSARHRFFEDVQRGTRFRATHCDNCVTSIAKSKVPFPRALSPVPLVAQPDMPLRIVDTLALQKVCANGGRGATIVELWSQKQLLCVNFSTLRAVPYLRGSKDQELASALLRSYIDVCKHWIARRPRAFWFWAKSRAARITMESCVPVEITSARGLRGSGPSSR